MRSGICKKLYTINSSNNDNMCLLYMFYIRKCYLSHVLPGGDNSSTVLILNIQSEVVIQPQGCKVTLNTFLVGARFVTVSIVHISLYVCVYFVIE